jgi:predicted ABC-type ATPase
LEGDDEYFAEFDTRGVLRADAAGRASYYNTMWNLGVLSVNEIRSLENLNPVESGDVRFVQLNMTTLDKAAQVVEEPAVVEEIVTVEEPAATPADAPTVIEVLDQYRSGSLTLEGAKALLMVSFPQTPEAMIDAILAGVVVKEPEPVAPEPVAEPPAPEPLAASLPASRDCGTGSGGFKPGNKCAGEGGGGGGGSDSSSSAGSDAVDSGGGGSDAPSHVEGSKAHAAREANRNARRVEDYPPANPQGDDTMSRHIGPDGDFTPQRQAMHDQIVSDATAGVPKSEEPTLYMMGGGPAAGKSSIIKNGDVRHPDQHVLANPDEFKADIPEYRVGLSSGDHKAAAFAHEESSHLNRRVMKTASGNQQDVVWDGTGDNSIEKLEQQTRVFKERGYKVQADYVTCDTDTAVERSNARGAKTGRVVPEEAIRETHARVSEIWPEAVSRGLFDRSDLYDTTAGGKPILIASARGTRLEIKDKAAYQRFLDKAKNRKRSRRKAH